MRLSDADTDTDTSTDTDPTTETTETTDTDTDTTTISTDIEALTYIASHPDLISFFGTDTDGAIVHYNEFAIADGREITFDATQ